VVCATNGTIEVIKDHFGEGHRDVSAALNYHCLKGATAACEILGESCARTHGALPSCKGLAPQHRRPWWCSYQE